MLICCEISHKCSFFLIRLSRSRAFATVRLTGFVRAIQVRRLPYGYRFATVYGTEQGLPNYTLQGVKLCLVQVHGFPAPAHWRQDKEGENGGRKGAAPHNLCSTSLYRGCKRCIAPQYSPLESYGQTRSLCYSADKIAVLCTFFRFFDFCTTKIGGAMHLRCHSRCRLLQRW